MYIVPIEITMRRNLLNWCNLVSIFFGRYTRYIYSVLKVVRWILGRHVPKGEAGGARAPPDFGRSEGAAGSAGAPPY